MDHVNNDTDTNFEAIFTTPRQVLLNYTNSIQALRTIAEKKYHVRPLLFDNYVFYQYFNQRSKSDENSEPLLTSLLKIELLKHIRNRRRQIICWLSYLLLALLCFFVYRQGKNHGYESGMRMWRMWTLPLIKRFPSLTELYDESCLMQNPFFEIEDFSCEPCAYVDSVIEVLEDDDNDSEKDVNKQSLETFVPFIFKINQSVVEMSDFHNIYIENQEIFRRDAFRVQSTNRKINNLDDLFYRYNGSSEDHNLWRFNRMLPVRIIRPLLARPSKRLPNTGIALERFISFDTLHAPTYSLPSTECENVYVQQLKGTRFIILRPTSSCRHICKTLSMRLPQSYVLSYNWWYWKPISAPDPVAETSSISLIGSYC